MLSSEEQMRLIFRDWNFLIRDEYKLNVFEKLWIKKNDRLYFNAIKDFIFNLLICIRPLSNAIMSVERYYVRRC